MTDTSLLCNRYSVVRRQRISKERKRRREGVGGKAKVRDDIDIGINTLVGKHAQLHLAALRSGPGHYVAK